MSFLFKRIGVAPEVGMVGIPVLRRSHYPGGISLGVGRFESSKIIADVIQLIIADQFNEF